MNRRVGHPTALSSNDERALAAWARWHYTCQLGQTKRAVREQAHVIAAKRDPKYKFKFGPK